MKTTPSRRYDELTSDMQVTALKHCAYAVFMFAGSFLLLGVMTWAVVVLRELRDTDAEAEE